MIDFIMFKGYFPQLLLPAFPPLRDYGPEKHRWQFGLVWPHNMIFILLWRKLGAGAGCPVIPKLVWEAEG